MIAVFALHQKEMAVSPKGDDGPIRGAVPKKKRNRVTTARCEAVKGQSMSSKPSTWWKEMLRWVQCVSAVHS